MLAESVEAFTGAVDIDEGLRAESVLAIDLHWSQLPRCFLNQLCAAKVAIRYRAIFAGDGNGQSRGGQGHVVGCGLHRPLGLGPVVFRDHRVRKGGKRRRGRVADTNDGVGAHLQLQRAGFHCEKRAVVLLLHGGDRIERGPLGMGAGGENSGQKGNEEELKNHAALPWRRHWISGCQSVHGRASGARVLGSVI